MNYRKFLFLFLILISVISCAPTSPRREQSSKLTVAASIFPVADISRQIGGDKINVVQILPANANPHTFNPSPSTIIQLQKVDIFLGVHPHFDNWIKKFISSEKIFFIWSAQEKEKNPHKWLYIAGARFAAEEIKNILIKHNKQHESFFIKNFEHYDQALTALHKEFLLIFDKHKGKSFVQWHPSWDYLARDYHLRVVGTIESGHGHQISMQKMKQLIAVARREQAKAIVVNRNIHSKTAEALSRELHLHLVELDGLSLLRPVQPPLIPSYLELMRQNAHQLAKALE